MKFLLPVTIAFAVFASAIFAQINTPSISMQDKPASPGVDTFRGNFANESNLKNEPLTLWYRRPAKVWTEALAIGNGRLGAMIFGGIEGERIQLNEDTLWAGSPYDANNPEALAALPEVRRLVFAGKYAEAEKMIDQKIVSRPARQMPYQPIGDLRLAFPKVSAVANYQRSLNLDNAVSKVTFEADGTIFTREIFSTAIDNVIVVHLTANKKGKISFAAAMQTPQRGAVSIEDADTLVLSGKNGDARGIEGKLKFQSRVKIIKDGGEISSNCEPNESLFAPYSLVNEAADPRGVAPASQKINNSCLAVKNADSVTLLISAATSYKNYQDVSGDEIAAAKNPIASAAKKSFADLKKNHIADYQKLFRRVSLELDKTSAAELPTDERIKNFSSGNDPQFATIYFQFGRYLLISSSRPGTQTANLQGIWNDSMTPPWDSKYTININIQMNYWLAEPTNLSELTDPLVKMVEDISQTGSKTARQQWGARGWVTHHNTDLWRQTSPVDHARAGMWSLGGAWLTMPLWEHYEYTQDRAFLEKIYPILKGASEFFVDTLVEDPKHKWLVTNPSNSPENRHPFGSTTVAGPTMDAQILRDLFSNTIRAAEILGKDKDFQTQLAQTRRRLAPTQIGKAGQIQEWMEDWDLDVPEPKHRHVSHLYAVYPSWQINVFENPDLINAAKKTLDMRGDDATGWAIAWRLNLWARMHDAERAYKILALLIQPTRTYPNLFDAHPPFQIDGNFGGTSGITEFLMQNRIKDNQTEIQILPALPKAFANGKITGLRARGGFEIDIEWKNGKLVKTKIRSLFGNPFTLRYGSAIYTGKSRKGQVISWNGTDK